jgi:hypothetical protein
MWCFDMLTVGHMRFLESLQKMGYRAVGIETYTDKQPTIYTSGKLDKRLREYLAGMGYAHALYDSTGNPFVSHENYHSGTRGYQKPKLTKDEKRKRAEANRRK